LPFGLRLIFLVFGVDSFVFWMVMLLAVQKVQMNKINAKKC
jgi:hypothetical protein